MEAKKEEKCESEEKKLSYIKAPQQAQDSGWDIGNNVKVGTHIDINFMAFVVKVIRIFYEQATSNGVIDAERMVMDMLQKFFEENKGKAFSDFTKKVEDKTVNNVVAQ